MLIVKLIRRILLYWILSPGLASIVVKMKKLHKSSPREDVVNNFKEPDFKIWLKYGTDRDAHAFPLENIRYQGGISFSKSQHHFVKYYENGVLSLRQFFQMHQPNNVLEAHFLYNDIVIESPPPLRSLPWQIRTTICKGEAGLTAMHGYQAFGPVTDKKISVEAKRLDTLLKSINKFGYFPELFDGHPRGYLLVDDLNSPNRQHFIISGGQHRVAVLSYLGFTEILLNFEPTLPREIKASDIENWPGVKTGAYSKKLAYKIFYSYFRGENLNLLKNW